MDVHKGELFVKDFLSHAYDPQKAHDYYERTKKLKGRKKGQGDKSSDNTSKGRVTAITNNAAENVGPERSAAIQRLADQAKEQLSRLTEEFRSWVDSHPKATDKERLAKRQEVVNRKNDIIRTLKSDVAKITSAASSKTKAAATEGRHH